MVGFFVGMTLVIRANSPAKVIVGVALMVITPVTHQWIAPAILRGESLKLPKLVSSLGGMLPLLGPVILLFVLITIAGAAGREFGYWGVLLFLLFMAPMVSILGDAFQGTRHWEINELASAWANLTLYTMGLLIGVLGFIGVLFFVYPVGFITLLISLGDLMHQWFTEAGPVKPFLCKHLIDLPFSLPCGPLLAVWHISTVFLMWWLADKLDLIVEKLAGLLSKLR